jgi:hypothetical protein
MRKKLITVEFTRPCSNARADHPAFDERPLTGLAHATNFPSLRKLRLGGGVHRNPFQSSHVEKANVSVCAYRRETNHGRYGRGFAGRLIQSVEWVELAARLITGGPIIGLHEGSSPFSVVFGRTSIFSTTTADMLVGEVIQARPNWD